MEARAIHQGDIYWIRFDQSSETVSDIPHPYVVIQDDVLNHSRLKTVVVCALTSKLKRAALPGNILIEAGEAELPKASVIEVSKVSSVEKTLLGAYIGTLSEQRIAYRANSRWNAFSTAILLPSGLRHTKIYVI